MWWWIALAIFVLVFSCFWALVIAAYIRAANLEDESSYGADEGAQADFVEVRK